MDQYNIALIIQLLGALITAGIATERQIADALRAHSGDALTDEQLNAIVDGVTADAERRKALAEADLTQAKADGAQ